MDREYAQEQARLIVAWRRYHRPGEPDPEAHAIVVRDVKRFMNDSGERDYSTAFKARSAQIQTLELDTGRVDLSQFSQEEMDCGTELDRIAKRNREIDPALTYNDALNLAYLEHPKLATRYLGRPVRIDKVQEVQKYVDAAVVKRYDRTAYGIIANVVTGLPKMNDGSIDMDAAVRAVNDHDQLQAACQEKLEDLVKTQVALDGIAASETMKPEMMNGMRQRVRPRPPSWWKFVFSVSEPEKFLPQLPYNEQSQRNQGLAIPLQAAFSTETCLSSCQPSIRRM
jgi:hypothetical protein